VSASDDELGDGDGVAVGFVVAGDSVGATVGDDDDDVGVGDGGGVAVATATAAVASGVGADGVARATLPCPVAN
jgi:hypothetical protein